MLMTIGNNFLFLFKKCFVAVDIMLFWFPFRFNTRCHQLLVNYTKIPWHEWQQHPRKLDKIEWDVADTKLLINSEGCGYPETGVNCTEFAKQYG